MEKRHNYRTAFEVAGKSADELFQELCYYRPHLNPEQPDWKEKFINAFGEMLQNMPNPRKVTNQIIHEELEKKGLPDFDPEKVYVNKFGSSHKDFGEEYFHHEFGSLIWSYSVTDACLMNVFGRYYSDSWGDLLNDAWVGLYTAGHDSGPWGPENIVPIMPIEIYNIIYYRPIAKEYNSQVRQFWDTYQERFTYFLEDNYLASAIQQYKNQLLSEAAFIILQKLYNKSSDIAVDLVYVYSYPSTDILLIKDSTDVTGRLILYIPGARIPFVEFLQEKECKEWIAEQLKNSRTRNAFANHFSIYNRQDGIEYSGVDTALKGFADGTWDPQQYIQFSLGLDHNEVFKAITEFTKQRMYSDGDIQIKSDSELTRDHALGFFHALLSQLSYITLLVPEVLVPLEITVSLTSVGLSVDKMVSGDTLQERYYGLGELTESSIFLALNMIPVFIEAGVALKDFTRSFIPEVLTEEQAISKLFNIIPNDITTNSPLYSVLVEDKGYIHLARLADQGEPLAVMKEYAGNKYIRLDPITLNEIEGPFISKIYNEDLSEFIFVGSGRLSGGSPYNPLEMELTKVMSIETLHLKAAVTGRPIGASYKQILDSLELFHNSASFTEKSNISFDLMDLIEKYRIAHPTSGRIPAFDELYGNLEDFLFTEGMQEIKTNIISILNNHGKNVAKFMYSTMLNELCHGYNIGITKKLTFFLKEDYITKSAFEGYAGTIPADLGFEPHFVIDDLNAFLDLPNEYYNLPPFEGLELHDNLDVLEYVVDVAHQQKLLENCVIREHKLFIGYDLDEIENVITGFSSNSETPDKETSVMLVAMIRELTRSKSLDISEKGMIKLYATRDFYNKTVSERVQWIEKASQIASDFNFSVWDQKYHYSTELADLLAGAESPAESIGYIMAGKGATFSNSRQSLEFILNNFNDFTEVGLKNICLPKLNYRMLHDDIASYFAEGVMSAQLDAAIMTIDAGAESQPYRKLFEKAKSNNVWIHPSGGSNTPEEVLDNAYESFFKQAKETMRSQYLLNDTQGKFMIIAPKSFHTSIPAINSTFPSIAQIAGVPAVEVDEAGLLKLITEEPESRSVITPGVSSWPDFASSDGYILEWKNFGIEYEMPTTASRRNLLFAGMEETEIEDLDETLQTIKFDVNDLACEQPGTCADVSMAVKERLQFLGYETGQGRTMLYWKRSGNDYMGMNHTAISVIVNDEEFIVDATHRQFPHSSDDREWVIIVRPEQWMDEIANRTKAIRPWIVPGMRGASSLALMEPPIFTKPRRLRVD